MERKLLKACENEQVKARDATRPPLFGVLVMIGVSLESAMRYEVMPIVVLLMRIVWGVVHKNRGDMLLASSSGDDAGTRKDVV